MQKHSLHRILIIAILLITVGCQGEVNTPAPSTGQTISFSAQIQPIFNELCRSCHAAGGFSELTGIRMRLSTAQESFAALVNQPSALNSSLIRVIPGDAANSLLFQKVSQNRPPVGETMPLLGRRLSSAELGILRDWINQGAPNN